MKTKFSLIQNTVIIIIMTVLFAGCGNRVPEIPTSLPIPQAVEVNLILNPNISDVMAGQTVALSIEASGQGLQFKWSVTRGILSALDTPAVIYTAPNTPGVDTVAVEVTSSSSTTTKSVSFNIMAPPTDTPMPTSVPTETPLPPPPLVEIFSQAKDGKEFVFINSGGVLSNEFVIAQDCLHSGIYGLLIEYDMKGAGNGGWGVEWSDSAEKNFDASEFSALTFWVKAVSGNPTFQIGLKDTNGKEVKVESKTILVSTLDWALVTVPFSEFEGVNAGAIENFNLGFNKNHGSGSICVDDIAFVP